MPRATAVEISTRSKRLPEDQIPYSSEALRQDLARVRLAWEACQSSRDRNAIYGYLSAVFDCDVVGSRRSCHRPGTLGVKAPACGLADCR
jgi:hypothetical protein